MTSLKTIPLLLLTLAACNSCVHAAPAVNPPGSPNPGDSDPTPVADPTDAPTASLFFTPAVFLPDYYSQPPPTPAAAAPADHAAYFTQDTVASDAATEPVAEAKPDDVASALALPSSTSAAELPVSSDSALEPTALDAAQETSASIEATTALESTATPSPSSGDIPLVFTISSEVVSFTLPASQLSSITPTSTSSHMAPNPSHSVSPTPGGDKHATESESTETQMSRKAAIIGTILAVASLLGISVCAFCMRCRVPRNVKQSTAGGTIEPFDATGDPEKALAERKPVSPTPSQQSSTQTLPLPSLIADAPNQRSQSAPSHDNSQNTQQRPAWQTHAATSAQRVSNDFEDVTHILSEDTFAPLSGSERSSAVSEVLDSSLNRASNGAPSVKAASYATCESRYSGTSVGTNIGEHGSRRNSSDGGASTEYLSMSPSSTPSPPESPVLRTPKQGVVTVTRTRSHTLNQSPSPRVKSTVSASKSFPARLSNRMSDADGVFEEESEWDIAAAYGARYSKGSVGARSTISEVPEEHEGQQPEGEHMETIDIGGRHVIMVTGYAF